MAREIRVGVIGCGKIADVLHVPGYIGVKGVRIAALMDVKRSQMEAIRARHGLDAECYTNLDRMLAADIDAVSICTPNVLHRPQTLAALKAGKHVLCEKPMAATTVEATEMIEAARRVGRVLQINQTLHYLPLYQVMARLVSGGAIGKPLHVRCLRAHSSSPDVGWSPGARWFVQAKCEGGIVRDIGVHMADMMRWAVGPVEAIAAFTDTRIPRIDVIDNASSILRFANGATGVLELSWTTPVGGNLFEVYGTEGTLRQGFDREHPIELLKAGTGKKPKVTYPKVPAKTRDSHQCFIDAIRGKAPSPTPGEVGREAVALCEAIAQSGGTGKFVKVKRF